MGIGTDYAASASAYKAAETQLGASVAILKKSMDVQSEIATQLIDMLSLNVGTQAAHTLDILV